ncbi:hypothetical protein [Pseudomonas aeruginosa]|uniref:hypothetical protein n=1 Tax=Pseudomonas aeruginosa TaxID=287 RepID=UPI001BC8DD57|nr:hypothetical protein [Pseudomonas aeruginosa]
MRVFVFLGGVLGFLASLYFLLVVLSFFPEGEILFSSGIYLFLKDVVGPFAAGLGGAVAGAFSSYMFQLATDREKSAVEAVNNYNRALAILNSKYNDLCTIKKGMVVPYFHHEVRFVMMPSLPARHPIQSNAIDFLCDSLVVHGLGDVFGKVVLAEERYSSSICNIAERNKMLEQYRAELDASDVRGGDILSMLVRIHGRERVIRLYQYTESMLVALDEALRTLYEVINALSEELAPKIILKNMKCLAIDLTSSAKLLETPDPKIQDIVKLIGGHNVPQA